MLENFSQNKAAILSGLFCGVPFDGVAASGIEAQAIFRQSLHSHMASYLYSAVFFLFTY